jgi:hypothetical protein
MLEFRALILSSQYVLLATRMHVLFHHHVDNLRFIDFQWFASQNSVAPLILDQIKKLTIPNNQFLTVDIFSIFHGGLSFVQVCSNL